MWSKKKKIPEIFPDCILRKLTFKGFVTATKLSYLSDSLL